jgi:2-iminobutanoate/2-iminopropanoate deaminase
MKRSVVSLILLFVSVAALAADSDRKHVVLDPSSARSAFPFSDAVLVANMFYVGGTAWWDKTDKPPADTEEEAKLAMEALKRVLESQGMEMDDLVSVQVYCTDLSLYNKFNGVYRTYFHEKFPARAFIGVASLIRSAHFELMGIAVRHPR